MNSKYIVVIVCLVISILLVPISPLLTVIGLIITVTIVMAVMISESAGKTVDRPILSACLREDGRGFVLKNFGNGDALDVRISVLPSNLEYMLARIEADDEEVIDCGQLLGNNRVIMNYTDEKREEYNGSADLNPGNDCEYDPFKPMIPIFK